MNFLVWWMVLFFFLNIRAFFEACMDNGWMGTISFEFPALVAAKIEPFFLDNFVPYIDSLSLQLKIFGK